MKWDGFRSIEVRYYLYEVTRTIWFGVAVYILLFQSAGLTYTSIHIIEVVYLITVFFAEIPTGYLGDRLGRRNTLVLGAVLLIMANLGYVVAKTPMGFAAVYVTFGLGHALQSGTDSAWLFETLQERNAQHLFTKVRGRARGLGLIAAAFGAIVGGYLGELSLLFPFLASAVVSSLGIPLLLSLPASEDRTVDGETGQPVSPKRALAVSREALFGPTLRPFVLYVVLIFGLFGVVQVWVQPIALSLGLVIKDIGWLYAGLIWVSGVLTYFSAELRGYLGLPRLLSLLPIIAGLLAVSVLVAPILAFPAFFVFRAVSRVLEPVEQQYLNEHITTVGRATVLSSISMAKGVAAIPIELIGGVVADLYSPIVAMGLVGIGLVTISMTLWRFNKPVHDGHIDDMVGMD
ncbi:MFS transporter [Haladaptatus sp. SPP-AMP-3]|uniref:MFS transporter n=1 Tax=Haladaptatus sp. SPP-AMP-3 TaxID=3121295 RepID=UPI003C2BCB05